MCAGKILKLFYTEKQIPLYHQSSLYQPTFIVVCLPLLTGSSQSSQSPASVKSQKQDLRGPSRPHALGIPGWRSGLAPAFGPGCDPGVPGSNPTSGSRCMEPASPSAYVSASLSLCDYHK
ncbi:hypothetical protein VULLAG_LOCUS23050 [Vulpes lagopus]